MPGGEAGRVEPKGDILKRSQHSVHRLTDGKSCSGRPCNVFIGLWAHSLRIWGHWDKGSLERPDLFSGGLEREAESYTGLGGHLGWVGTLRILTLLDLQGIPTHWRTTSVLDIHTCHIPLPSQACMHAKSPQSCPTLGNPMD